MVEGGVLSGPDDQVRFPFEVLESLEPSVRFYGHVVVSDVGLVDGCVIIDRVDGGDVVVVC